MSICACACARSSHPFPHPASMSSPNLASPSAWYSLRVYQVVQAAPGCQRHPGGVPGSGQGRRCRQWRASVSHASSPSPPSALPAPPLTPSPLSVYWLTMKSPMHPPPYSLHVSYHSELISYPSLSSTLPLRHAFTYHIPHINPLPLSLLSVGTDTLRTWPATRTSFCPCPPSTSSTADPTPVRVVVLC